MLNLKKYINGLLILGFALSLTITPTVTAESKTSTVGISFVENPDQANYVTASESNDQTTLRLPNDHVTVQVSSQQPESLNIRNKATKTIEKTADNTFTYRYDNQSHAVGPDSSRLDLGSDEYIISTDNAQPLDITFVIGP